MMKKTITIIFISILSIVALSSVVNSSGWGEQEERAEHEGRENGFFRGGWLRPRADVTPVQNEQYQSECGDCHFAYQPGLLSQNSWARIMSSLEDHYGDDASIDAELANEIRNYLLSNSADQASRSRSRAFAAQNVAGNDLPRITNTRYFRRKHNEIPKRFVQENPKVESFSRCEVCHTNANEGIYNEHQVRIPGVGRWDD